MNNPKAVVEMKHNFKMPSRIKNYKIEKEFCTIENGHICIANNININEKVLIKIYDKELFQYKHEELSLINNEIFMLRLINHRHCLKLYEIIESPSYVFLVMEYFNGIPLAEFIKQKKKLPEDDALNIYKQIVSVLVYIHDMNIGHLNINSNNIYIDNTNNIKIFEFKYSVFYSSKSKTKCEYLGDKLFLSPELCLKKQCMPELSDIWSSAAILYMLAVGEHPFLTKNELDSQKSIMKGEFRLPTTMSKIMQDFFKTAFEVKEESRYNIERMFKCALFRQKNITTDTLPLGLNVLSAKYPIDQRALTICKNFFNLDQDELKQKLIDNVFDPETSLYKQIVSKFTNKKVSSDGDLVSKKYSNYVNNNKYYYDEKIVKKNIQANLNKEYDIKQVNKEKEDDITRIQETSLIKLDDLLQSYEEYKKDPKSLDKRPKVNRKAEEEKKKEKQEAYENQKAKLEGKDKENKESKENTDKKSILKKKNSKVIESKSLNFGPDELKSKDFINKSRERRSVYDKKNNLRNLNPRRLSSNVNMDQELENSLEKFKNFQINQINKKSAMKKKYLNANGIIEESKEEEENQNLKKSGVKIKEEDYLEIPRRMPKRNKSLYQKKTEIKDDDEDEKIDMELSRKSSRRTKSFYGKKDENNSLDKEEPVIIRKTSSRKMKSKSFYQKKSISKIDDKDKEKLKEENEILRKNSKKMTNPNTQKKSSEKKENDNNSLSSSFSLSEEKNDVHDIDTNKNINSRKSNKNLKKVSFQANDFNFLENVGSKRESIEKKPSLKERSSIEKKPSLKENSNNDFIKKKPSLKIRSSMKKDSIKIEEPTENPENNNDNNNNNNNNNLESSTKIESERKNSSNENRPLNNPSTEKKSKNETELKKIRKQLESKYASLAQPGNSKSNKKVKISTRKSMNIDNEDMFKNQAVFLSKNELKKKKSKDDYNVNEKDIINEEEDINMTTPKFKKKKEEKIKNEEEEQKKLEEEKKRKKDDLERREKEDNEERQRILDRERAEKLMEEERKQEEEDERKRQLEEEEKKKQKKEEEEKRRLKREERDRKRKERDEEDRKKEKEDKLRKEKEKERQKKEEDDKIKKWKEEAKKKRENEEKKRIAEEERIKKEEEDERRARREENEIKRQLEEQENNRRLEEYKNKQKEEEDKRKKRENLRKQKEEEQRQKREREAKERKNKFMKKDEPKKKGGDSSDSGSGSEDDDSKNLKTLPNQDSNKMKKTFNFHSNPFDFFKTNTNESDEDSSPRVKKKPKQRSKRTSNEEQPKKKSSLVKAKYNDFLKFSQNDKNASESDGSESSSDEEEKKNNKNNEKKKLSKSIEIKKNSNNNKDNSLYNKFNNYFFHENTFNDDLAKNKKNKNNKDSKANQDNLNAKKGFYHYQNNPTKEEKRVVDKRFELRNVNTTGTERFNQLNTTDTITEDSHDNNKKAKEGKNKKNKFVKQNSVEVRKANELNGKVDNDILSVRFKRGRNKNYLENRQNNSVAYNHDMNLDNENNAPKSKANQNKNNLKKVKNEKEKEKNKKLKKAPKNIVQNLMTDFDQTMEEYSSIYATHNTSTKGAKAIKGFNEKNNKLKNSRSKLKTSQSKNLNSQTKLKTAKSKIKPNLKDGIDKKHTSKITSNNLLNNSMNEKSKNLNQSLNTNKDDKIKTNSVDKRKAKAKIKKDKEKDGKLRAKKDTNKDFNNLKNGNSNHASSNVIKIKRNATNMSSELKEEDLTLYRGQIDYNNVSIKNVEESIGDLMMKYKKKGFICIKKSREQFIFVKGPNTHHVELMKLGNGLLYFCVTK